MLTGILAVKANKRTIDVRYTFTGVEIEAIDYSGVGVTPMETVIFDYTHLEIAYGQGVST